MNMLNLMQMFRQNPMAVIQQRFNIPQGMNSPDAIINHLVSSGQVSQEQIDKAMNMKKSFQQFMR